MKSQPLSREQIDTVPNTPGKYIIRCRDEILSVTATKRLKTDLQNFCRDVQPPFAETWEESQEPDRRTQATTYVRYRHFEAFPPGELTFEYVLTSTKHEAELLRRTELQGYREQHGRLPPLMTRE